MATWFERRGYERLDEPSLASFMERRIADRARSVVVFALDYLPDAFAGRGGSERHVPVAEYRPTEDLN